MGRKIPAKKHRGVKDPVVQQARRLQSVQGKINAPPRDPDEQPVPRSLSRLFAPRPAPRARPRKPPRPPGAGAGGGGGRGVAGLRRLEGEGAQQFSRRISAAVRALHQPEHLHYPGAEEDEQEEQERWQADRRARRERRRQQGSAPAPAASSRALRLAAKKQAKKEKAAEEQLARAELQYERVPFGAVVHAPPALAAPRRARAHAHAARPGRRPLLLSALLAGGGAGPAEGAAVAARDGADGARRERARADAVAAYRALKAARRQPSSALRNKCNDS